MAVLFVSHASRDDATAVALEAWLRAKRLHRPVRRSFTASRPATRWAQALRDAAGACRVVVCLVTENWLASDECFGEFRAAWYMGKRIIPLFALAPERCREARAARQGAGGGSGPRPRALSDARRRARPRAQPGDRAAVSKAACAPPARLRGSASTPRRSRSTAISGRRRFPASPRSATRTPTPRCSTAAAARSRSRWRNCARCAPKGDLRPFVILGASGAGKSSLLKAGIIPRLRREAPAWLPLHAFRPGGDPLLISPRRWRALSPISARSRRTG